MRCARLLFLTALLSDNCFALLASTRRLHGFIRGTSSAAIQSPIWYMSSKTSSSRSSGSNLKKRKAPSTSTGAADGWLPFVPDGFDATRARLMTHRVTDLTEGACVVLWMSRDQRATDNHALLYAQGVAAAHNVPLKVVFNLVPQFLQATIRQYGFMIKGLQEVEQSLRAKGIPFHLTMGDPVSNIPAFAASQRALMVVVDFSPVRVPLGWVASVAAALDAAQTAPLVQVDAHNVVPCWVASDKLEVGARTIRNKIKNHFPRYLKEFAELPDNPPGSLEACEPIDWAAALAQLQIDRTIAEVTWLAPGPAAALRELHTFGSQRLKVYATKRNDPNEAALSNLSPYFHFGQLSPQRAALYVKSLTSHHEGADAFIEEAVVRRELSDNFCFYNANYDSLEGAADWAKQSLEERRTDRRSVIYTREQLEQALTHDDLWNAAQLQMVSEGKMHGFLRMYWAKKILEWTPSAAEALSIAIFLNDKYELDGRDPNGYVGCMWSICGVHDMGWAQRKVFGKIRFMNYAGCQKKFDVPKFVAKYPPARANARKVPSPTGEGASLLGK